MYNHSRRVNLRLFITLLIAILTAETGLVFGECDFEWKPGEGLPGLNGVRVKVFNRALEAISNEHIARLKASSYALIVPLSCKVWQLTRGRQQYDHLFPHLLSSETHRSNK